MFIEYQSDKLEKKKNLLFFSWLISWVTLFQFAGLVNLQKGCSVFIFYSRNKWLQSVLIYIRDLINRLKST